METVIFKRNSLLYRRNLPLYWLSIASFIAVLAWLGTRIGLSSYSNLVFGGIALLAISLRNVLIPYHIKAIKIDRSAGLLTLLLYSPMLGTETKNHKLNQVTVSHRKSFNLFVWFYHSRQLNIHTADGDHYRLTGFYGFEARTMELAANAIGE
jgi:hypothetical protein